MCTIYTYDSDAIPSSDLGAQLLVLSFMNSIHSVQFFPNQVQLSSG